MSLSCLWHQQGKKEHAHKLLTEVYGWFTETRFSAQGEGHCGSRWEGGTHPLQPRYALQSYSELRHDTHADILKLRHLLDYAKRLLQRDRLGR